MSWRSMLLFLAGYGVGLAVSVWGATRPGGMTERLAVAEVRWETAAYCVLGGGTPAIYFNGTRDEDLQLAGCVYVKTEGER